MHCLLRDVLCHTAYCYTTNDTPSPSQFYRLDPPISHWQLLWDILSQLARKTREVTITPSTSLPPERGRNTISDWSAVTLYSTGNMATQIVHRQWNGQIVFLCKINILVVYNVAFLSVSYSKRCPDSCKDSFVYLEIKFILIKLKKKTLTVISKSAIPIQVSVHILLFGWDLWKHPFLKTFKSMSVICLSGNHNCLWPL